MKTNEIVIGTRGSILALVQAEKVQKMLTEKYEELRKRDDFKGIKGFDRDLPLNVSLEVITTTGDKNLKNFSEMKKAVQKELFVKEIEKEMIEGKVDLAVHSLKDMPLRSWNWKCKKGKGNTVFKKGCPGKTYPWKYSYETEKT